MFTPKQYVEIFHLLFIRHLEGKLDKNLYALKGGCNLRFFFKSIRYSEDIDFDVRTIAKETLRQKINKSFDSIAFQTTLRCKGIEILRISEAKQTETTQRWKLSLRVGDLTMPLPTKIEFSRRGMTENFLFEPVDGELIRAYQLYPVLTNHYLLEAAFNQKIDALINRAETQARDIFDLKLLLDFGVKPRCLHEELRKKIEVAIANVMSIGFQEFKGHVVAYLLAEYQAYYDDPKIWSNMQSEVIAMLEGCQK
jgi:predicted nucleotidyltransferase component of viral defense system